MQRSPKETLIPLIVAASVFLLISCLATVVGEAMLRALALDDGAGARGGVVCGITLLTLPLAIGTFVFTRWLVGAASRRPDPPGSFRP